MDIMANVLLAAGCSPAMAHSLDEVEEVRSVPRIQLQLCLLLLLLMLLHSFGCDMLVCNHSDVHQGCVCTSTSYLMWGMYTHIISSAVEQARVYAEHSCCVRHAPGRTSHAPDVVQFHHICRTPADVWLQWRLAAAVCH